MDEEICKARGTYAEEKKCPRDFCEKTESPIGRRTRRWEDNIKVSVQEVGKGGMDWIELA
jgi:hypothetical protein